MIGRPAAAIVESVADLEQQLADYFGEHYDRLVRLAALICHSPSATEDAVQSAMEQAWRRRATLHDPSRMKQWLDRIVVRESIRTNRRPWWSRLGGAPTELAMAVPDRGAEIGPTAVAIVQAFRTLSIEQRAVVALHMHAGYTVEETAGLMSAGVETTRSRLRLARQRLRRELAEDEQ